MITEAALLQSKLVANYLPPGTIHTAAVGPTRYEKPEGVDVQVIDEGCCGSCDVIKDAINERLEVKRSECADGPELVELEQLQLTVAFYGDTSIPRTVVGEFERIEWEAYLNPWSGRSHVDGCDVFVYEVEA